MHGSRITRSQLILGIAIVALAGAAGVISERYVERRFPVAPRAQNQSAEPAGASPAEPLPVPPAACVNPDGTWRNWSSPNVPMLSPKCEDGK